MSFEYDTKWLFQPAARFCNCKSQNCHCGETNVHEWQWDKNNATYSIVLSENDLEVQFHNEYSFGTAAVRGTKVLEKGRYHYWEIKMLTPTYGTDVMVGVGTNKVDLNSTRNVFYSFLGLDQESFGFSYQGYIQHDGEKRRYGPCFGLGSIVGIYLDLWKGNLEFFLNRKPLGIAFAGLRDLMLYPMVCSTAAQSRVKLTYSYSVPASLQITCLSVLKSSHRTYLSTMFPGLRYLTESIFAEILKTHSNDNDENEKDERESLTEYMILDDFDFALVGVGRNKKK
ncbi:SPRY domain-containing SOCS box protein 3 [Eufriesea mexicana]|uniref:SPRY domain-containing SOCS box protein 3-like n=1 Tax=Eufriesea mexicana TaxID=516756 RepID=UPI00083C8743|nr:PREDICTED: SPRY domain-containing SOCS box protein 3-like [Eufriesea mexicana]OAD56958.1 SPRY domain-containing SOCS box protein 3 [Eufriesea mexicana]